MRVKLKHLLAWCGPCLPVAALGLPLVVYLPPHYAGTLGLPLATVLSKYSRAIKKLKSKLEKREGI